MLFGCQTTEENVEITYDRIEGIQEIDYESLQEKLTTATDFLLYIGRPDCSDCQLFYPILEEYIEEHEGSGIYYLNIKSFRDAANADDATQEEIDFYDSLKENLGFAWTPTLIHYQNGEKLDSYEFLDADFGRVTEETQQSEEYLQFVADFEEWMDENLKIDE